MPTDDANPAALVDHDPAWAAAAQRRLTAIRARLDGLPGADHARYDHIGSTSVPGLAAKPWIDLQVHLLPLPGDEDLIPRLVPLGLERAQGSRPDSPGVRHDIPRGGAVVDPEVWTKSLFVDPAEHVILHVRRSDSPWGSSPSGSATGCARTPTRARATRR